MSTPAEAEGTRTPDSNLLGAAVQRTLGGGSETPLHRIKNAPGYVTPVFKGKQEQRAKVEAIVAGKVRIDPLLHLKSFLAH